MRNLISLKHRKKHRHLLVENKVSFQGPETELSIYDTYRPAKNVGLFSDQLLYCGMVSGKKVMHDKYNEKGKTFLPFESYVLPPGGTVHIDFPKASEASPTTCLTLEISKERIQKISERMQDVTMLDGLEHDWQYQPSAIHVRHTQSTQSLLERLIFLHTENHTDKEILLDFGLSELVIKLLRSQSRQLLLNYSHSFPDASGITVAVNYIEQHMAIPLDIDVLCIKSCMSRSRFYVEFKKQLGCTPFEFQLQSRLQKAAEYLKAGKSATEVCFSLGFKDLSHFSRRFTDFFGCPPSRFLQYHD